MMGTNKSTFNVAADLDFNPGVDEEETEKVGTSGQDSKPKTDKNPPAAKKTSTTAAIDPNRNYSPYYTPKPKKGSKGGTLGRGAVDASERKVQFSLTCTPAQKEAFAKAAKAEKRKLPEFICLAVEEYIENHGL